jgi:hypothetical protein
MHFLCIFFNGELAQTSLNKNLTVHLCFNSKRHYTITSLFFFAEIRDCTQLEQGVIGGYFFGGKFSLTSLNILLAVYIFLVH